LQSFENRFDVGNKGLQIFLKKGNTKIMFHKIMSTNKSFVAGIDFLPKTTSGMANIKIDEGK
jgi:hypothetical protein